MPDRKEATSKERHIHINDDLPTLYVDSVHTRHREDGVNYLSFATAIPDRLVEQVRLIIDDASLQRIIDNLCQNTNYFPEKPSEKGRGLSK